MQCLQCKISIDSKRKFCSKSCSSIYNNSHRKWSEQSKQKISASLTGKTRKPHSDETKQKMTDSWKAKLATGWKTWQTGLTKDDPRLKRNQEAVTKALKNNPNWGNGWNKGLTIKTDERVAQNGKAISVALKEKFQKDPEFKKKMAFNSSRNWQSSYNFPNKIEKKIQDLLPESFKGNQFIENMQVDFVDEDKKIIIEVNGDFWHCNPQIFEDSFWHKPFQMTAKQVREKEQQKIEKLQSSGYTVFIIWEYDIQHNFDSVQRILQSISSK